jgi:acyl-coenzyme A thioesterase PaaI-like protein
MAEEAFTYDDPIDVTEGPWAGWRTWGAGNDPYETLTGPYFLREEADGSVTCGYTPEAKNLNGGGNVHGGSLMTFADFCLFAHAKTWTLDHYVTVQFESQFIGAGKPDVAILSTGEVVRQTRSMLFVRGIMTQEGKPVFSYSGILKRVAPRG